MEKSSLLSKRGSIIAGGIIAVLLIGAGFAFEPVTRNYVATDWVCSYCHRDRDYDYNIRLSFTKQHPIELKEDQEAARCVDCHLPEGLWASVYAYTHFVSITDLYGHFRDREGERAGDWIPLSAARAYRVRDRLHEYDSVTCRSCHIEAEIVPKRDRGKKAHADALKNKDTCMECHTNLVHRFVEVREIQTATGAEEGESVDEFGDEFSEGLEEDMEGTDDEMEVL